MLTTFQSEVFNSCPKELCCVGVGVRCCVQRRGRSALRGLSQGSISFSLLSKLEKEKDGEGKGQKRKQEQGYRFK